MSKGPAEFDAAQAELRVRNHLASIPPLAGSMIARDTELDVAGAFAFSVLPRLSGLAGEIIYLVATDRMFTSGSAEDFDQLMARLGAGKSADALPLERLCRLFVRLRVVRQGIVLQRVDGHPLLKPGQIPSERFVAPRRDVGATGAHLQFWFFDTLRQEPVLYDVLIAPDGKTTFKEEKSG